MLPILIALMLTALAVQTVLEIRRAGRPALLAENLLEWN